MRPEGTGCPELRCFQEAWLPCENREALWTLQGLSEGRQWPRLRLVWGSSLSSLWQLTPACCLPGGDGKPAAAHSEILRASEAALSLPGGGGDPVCHLGVSDVNACLRFPRCSAAGWEPPPALRPPAPDPESAGAPHKYQQGAVSVTPGSVVN